jgi:hypothetical protein
MYVNTDEVDNKTKEVNKMDNEHRIEDILKTINLVNYQVAELVDIKTKLERQLIELMGRAIFITDDNGKYIMTDIAHEGVKQHIVGKYKFKIKTDYNISVNKEEYEIIKCSLRTEFNPVIEKIAFSVNNKVLKDIEKYGSDDDKCLIQQFIVKTPAKPYVSIEANA